MKYRHTVIVGLILSLAVVAFGSKHPYISNPGTLLDDFEDVSDWDVMGTDATMENDTSVFKHGTQSIKLNAVSGNYAAFEKSYVDLDMSSGDGISFWVYIVDRTKLESGTIYFYGENDYSKHFRRSMGLTNNEVKNGWNYRTFSKSEFTNRGTDSWDNARVKIRFQIISNEGEDASVCFDEFRFGTSGKAKVMITFDDGEDSVIDKAYPVMAGNSQAGVSFIVSSDIGTVDKMTLVNLTTLKDAGWDISNHTAEHSNLTEVSQEEMEADIDGGYDWLVANGFRDTAKFFAYPYTAYNDAVVAKVKQRHVLARTAWAVAGQYHFNIQNFEDLQYYLGSYYVKYDTAVATVQTEIDRAIERSGVLVLLFHEILDEGANDPGEYLTADFQTISDYLKTKQDAGELEVITFSDYYNALIELEPFCLEEPAMDFNGDCKVDFADFALFTQSWLECNLDPESACWE